jgi:hypothetical protein
MPIKVKVSFTPDEEAKITRLEALLKSLLPRHKVKKTAGTPPYNHLYFTPTKPGKPCNIKVFDDLKKG